MGGDGVRTVSVESGSLKSLARPLETPNGFKISRMATDCNIMLMIFWSQNGHGHNMKGDKINVYSIYCHME